MEQLFLEGNKFKGEENKAIIDLLKSKLTYISSLKFKLKNNN